MNLIQQIIQRPAIVIKHMLLLFCLAIVSLQSTAQRDTTKKQSIDITSSFKPVLRDAVKINLSGSQLNADNSKIVGPYNIPSQNLFYAYQPISIKPLALEQDSNLYLGDRMFVKAGFGNYTTPYLKAGLSFGDGKTSLVNVYGSYIASKGDIRNQDYSLLDVKGTGSLFFKNNEAYASAGFSDKHYYLYGYDHGLYDYKKDEVSQELQDINIKAGIRNTATTQLGINYDPNIQFNFFTNRNRLTENTISFDLPAEKKFGDAFAFKVDAKADISNYSTTGFVPANYKLTNNLVQIAPALVYYSPNFTINGGITPAWNNGKFSWLPNIYLEAKVPDKPFMVQAGWVGRYTNNTYRNLSAINPYLLGLTAETNTKETEYYGGIKASIGKHFVFNAKAGWIMYKDLPFFINDTATDSKGFVVANESKVNDLRIHGDLSFMSQDKFTLTAGLTLNGYTGMQDNARAWNTVPLDFTASMRYWAFKKLLLKGDFNFFGGGNYLLKGNTSYAFSGGSDLSAGAEYKINKQFSAWLDINNIFNNKYERWHNYQVYGLNLVGGIIVNF